MVMQVWRPGFELNGINLGSWYYCLLKLTCKIQLLKTIVEKSASEGCEHNIFSLTKINSVHTEESTECLEYIHLP